MITLLAKSRIKYNKSRTLLTAIAITLTTMLLMALGTSALGLMDFNRQQASTASNIHANLGGLTSEQVAKLSRHADVESLETNEIFASIEYGKMNGFLTYSHEIKGGIYQGIGNLIEGKPAEKDNEICGPSAFFKRMGVKPEIGEKVDISFRVSGKGEIQTKEFVISGLVSERDISKADISDSRIAYGAEISEKLVKEYMSSEDRTYNAAVRVYGEGSLNYDEMTSKINDLAKDIGVSEDSVNLNKEYLATMTDPGTDTLKVVVGIALLIVIFSGIVIYSIYYVGVITDIQEIGKLKAIGAGRKQIKKMLLKEGFFVAGISIPAGLILGFLIPYFLLPVVMEKAMENNVMAFEVEHIHMFSLHVMIIVAVVVILTVYISLLKPMRMAARISPVEAIRYQEISKEHNTRKGNREVNVFRLSKANLTRNKKRTAVTMITMGLSCILFMSVAGAVNSMSAYDIANRNLQGSDFQLYLDYSLDDREYPENNLQNIQMENPLGSERLKEIQRINGVKEVRLQKEIAVTSDYPSELFVRDGEAGVLTLGRMTRQQAEEYEKELEKGKIDYDKMVKEHGAVYTSDVFWDDYGLKLNDKIDVTVYQGDEKRKTDISIQATVDDGSSAIFMVPEEIFDGLEMKGNTTTAMFIDVEDGKYDEVKESLEELVDSNELLGLYSKDEEMELGAMSVNMMKYPMYAILLMIAVIGFMNLINTMITSIITRKRELGVLQAIGLSDRQMMKMLAGEGMVFTLGTLISSLTIGNLFGYFVFLWAKDSGFMSVSAYHYPVWETLGLIVLLVLGQLAITAFIGKRVKRESIIERIRSGE